MADEDEIDILGDFSFNSCFAQNNQGIPSCSSREDTVHPQWLLDSTEANWYDKESKNNLRDRGGPARELDDNNSNDGTLTIWTANERKVLVAEMAKYGRNIKKISQAIKTKTEIEIQTLIDAEYGIYLEPTYEIDKYDEEIPGVVQEEIVSDSNIKQSNKVMNNKYSKSRSPKKRSNIESTDNSLSPTEIFYEDEMIVGSTESIGSELDSTDLVSKNVAKFQAKIKEKKLGNHRRKVSRNYDKKKSVKELLSPQARQRKDSGLSDESIKSPKMQIVLGSGQALPVSEGEEVIKIEKKKDSEAESDIEVDVDSDSETTTKPRLKAPSGMEVKPPEEPIAVPLTKFEPMPKRQKRINLDGGGGYTIMHTEAGDLYAVGAEPKRERQPRKQPVTLIPCRMYGGDRPAPFEVHLSVSALIQMDVHGHTSRGEVMGLTGGSTDGRRVHVKAYRPAHAAAATTHCDMDPVSQSRAASQLSALGLVVVGWHHSHPLFPAAPSALDLRSQAALQRSLEWRAPLLAFITSQQRPPGRHASTYTCIRIEEDESTPTNPVGYRLKLHITADITLHTIHTCLEDITRCVNHNHSAEDRLAVDMVKDVCPQAGTTHLEKCISSIRHHMNSAGYAEDDPIAAQLIKGVRDIFR